MHDKYKTKSQLIEELQESRDVRTQLAEALVRTKVSLSIGDETIKRLYKENAELKAYKDVNKDFKTAWEQLKAENERLKEEILKWQTAYSRQYQINENKGYNKKEEQYRQTLQEIKAIAMDIMDDDIEESFAYSDARQILDLITKAEEE